MKSGLFWPATLLGLVTTFSKLHGQDVKKYIRENSSTVASIDPLDTEFNDLDAIGRATGRSRIVLLGEQDHGDALTFSAKTRLVKYLHEKLDFNVLAFESDFFALNEGWDNVGKSDAAISNFLKKNLLHLWINCKSCSELLYNFIPSTFKTGRPLQVAGFDNQLFLSHSLTRLPAALDSFIKKNDLQIRKGPGL